MEYYIRFFHIMRDSDHGYYIVCDIDYTNECKERTEQLALFS